MHQLRKKSGSPTIAQLIFLIRIWIESVEFHSCIDVLFFLFHTGIVGINERQRPIPLGKKRCVVKFTLAL